MIELCSELINDENDLIDVKLDKIELITKFDSNKLPSFIDESAYVFSHLKEVPKEKINQISPIYKRELEESVKREDRSSTYSFEVKKEPGIDYSEDYKRYKIKEEVENPIFSSMESDNEHYNGDYNYESKNYRQKFVSNKFNRQAEINRHS